MKKLLFVAGVLLALSCKGGSGADTSTLHDDCTAKACAQGEACVEYAGFDGTPHHTCEIHCTKNSECPEGLTCMSIADGPGQVCD